MTRPNPGRRLCAGLLCVVLMVLLTMPPAGADVLPAPESREVGAACLICLDNNQILYEKDPGMTLYPASTVKIMTGLLACRSLAGRLDERVTLTSSMLAGVTGRSLQLAVGETLTVRDLLYAALCGSYNDACCALAVLVCGSQADFVSEMNREAARLGASDTRYVNVTGVHDDGMVTTLHDTVAVAREAYGDELYMTVTSASAYTIPATNASPERVIGNRNLLLSDTSQVYHNGWCRGMSAGMTDEGGWCVVTVYERAGASLLCVVMQGADVPSGVSVPAYLYVNSLLSWARSQYGLVEVISPGTVMDTVKVGLTGLSSSKTKLITADSLSVYLPLGTDPAGLETSWAYTGKWADTGLTAPVMQGETVGYVTVRYGGEVVGTAPLTVSDSFSRNGFMGFMTGFRAYLGSRAFLITLISFCVLLALYIPLVRKSGGRYRTRTWSSRRRRLRRLFLRK